MNCPLCQCSLHAIEAADIELDQCSECHGIWFDKDELRPFIEFVLAHRDDIELAAHDTKKLQFSVQGAGELTYPCPVCDVEMHKFNYAVDSNVILDRCPECAGLWVEKPEIRGLASFMKANPVDHRNNEFGTAFDAEQAGEVDPSEIVLEATLRLARLFARLLGGKDR